MADQSGQPTPNLLGRLGKIVGRVYPDLDRQVWNRQRDQHVAAARGALVPAAKRLSDVDCGTSTQLHLVLVASPSPSAANWHDAGGNLVFEAYTSAQELLGTENVTLFSAESDEDEAVWQTRLLNTLRSTEATHLFALIEGDPNQPGNWSWDVVASLLDEHWDGVFIGFMHDAAYEWLSNRARRLGSIMRRLLIVEIAQPMADLVRPGQYEVGPVTMPMSQATIDLIDERVAGLPKRYDVTFIGALYGYRIELLEHLRSQGIRVAVNPHRSDATTTEAESRTNLPSYLDYLAGLAQSEMTVNFSRANAGPFEQYKIRVQEAALVGCICLTDDQDRSNYFFTSRQVPQFNSVDSLAAIVADRLSDRERLRADQDSARKRAHDLGRNDFWGRVEVGLGLRGLRGLTGVQPPPDPQ